MSNCHFFQKNAFFGQKKAFFQKVHFIQKCSVTLNTVFQCVKNIFFLSQKKIIFFTILNLIITDDASARVEGAQWRAETVHKIHHCNAPLGAAARRRLGCEMMLLFQM